MPGRRADVFEAERDLDGAGFRIDDGAMRDAAGELAFAEGGGDDAGELVAGQAGEVLLGT
jgi:hypothetical protein